MSQMVVAGEPAILAGAVLTRAVRCPVLWSMPCISKSTVV